MPDEETVLIDTPQRLRAVASLAVFGVRYRPAFDAIRSLALSVGCEVSGGRIFERPAGRYPSVAHGWQHFVERAAVGDLPPRLRDRMVMGGGSVTLDGDLADRLRAARDRAATDSGSKPGAVDR